MPTNRYAASCAVCKAPVPANGGALRKSGSRWLVTHLACADGEAGVFEVRFGDKSFTRNRAGRCEDAPCCGCCTI